MRYTKIVCTLGPASMSKDQIRSLAKGGMNVARLNLSHGKLEQHGKTIRTLEEINAELRNSNGVDSACIGILLDTQGPEIRTGDVAKPIAIQKGDEVVFSPHTCPEEKRPVIIILHDKFPQDAEHAERILIDNGELVFDFIKILPHGGVLARSRDTGAIGSRRHVNLPGATLSMPSFLDKDWEDMAFAAKEQVDFLALSFIRTAKDIEVARAFLSERKSTIQIIAKIETRQAVENIEEIIAASDGIMVARGDLGAEVPFERVPVIQDQIVALCKSAGKPVIVATHMLESMIHQPMPTRAEVTDIAHAAATATDATMLSGETASGQHPLEALDAMVRVLRETERHIGEQTHMEMTGTHTEREARAEAAVTLAISIEAKALVVMTRSGRSARDVCKFRPHLPVIAFTPDARVQRTLQLSFGVLPVLIDFDDDPEKTVVTALQAAIKAGLLKAGDQIVLVSDTKAHDRTINTIQIRGIW